MNTSQEPYVEIIEQPASGLLRFRYECEGRGAGSLLGVSSSVTGSKTYPAIKVQNYKGKALVIVSCVTKDVPYMPHPYNLVGKDGCKDGVCIKGFEDESMTCTFSNLGIQCVKRRKIEESLRNRRRLGVDPFKTGYSVRHLGLNVVRLCFQVSIEGNIPGALDRHLEPVVSEPIYDKKAISNLLIYELSHDSGPSDGGQKMILLCEKVAKEDLRIKFFDHHDWQVCIQPEEFEVWKQVAIKLKTPAYPNLQGPVSIQLLRISDGAESECRSYKYISEQDRNRKIPRLEADKNSPCRVSLPEESFPLVHGFNLFSSQQCTVETIDHSYQQQPPILQDQSLLFVPNSPYAFRSSRSGSEDSRSPSPLSWTGWNRSRSPSSSSCQSNSQPMSPGSNLVQLLNQTSLDTPFLDASTSSGQRFEYCLMSNEKQPAIIQSDMPCSPHPSPQQDMYDRTPRSDPHQSNFQPLPSFPLALSQFSGLHSTEGSSSLENVGNMSNQPLRNIDRVTDSSTLDRSLPLWINETLMDESEKEDERSKANSS